MLLFVVIFIALQNSSIQNRIFQSVVTSLSKKLDTEVHLGKAYYQFFNTFALEDLYIEDQHKDTLVYIEKLDLHFHFFSIFSNQIVVNSIELDGLDGNLKTDSTGTNFNFIIDAFQSPKKEPSTTSIAFDIQKVSLKNSSFSYVNLMKDKKTYNTFNANAMYYTDLNAEMKYTFVNKDSMLLSIDKFSAVEQSGLKVTDLKTKAFMTPKGIFLSFLDINLPNSSISLGEVSLSYDSISAMKDFASKVKIKLPLNESLIAWSDFAAFYPEFKNIKGEIAISGILSGRISSLRFQNFKFKYGKSTTLLANLDLNGLPNLSETFVYGDINKLSLTVNELQDFIANLSRKPVKLPQKLGNINFKGNISGFFSNLVAYGNLKTSAGSLSTDIQLQFSNNLSDLEYSGKLKSNKLEIGELLGNKMLGNVAFDITTKGQSTVKSGLKGTVVANIGELYFNEYNYKDIKLDGAYDGNGFNGVILVEDENISADFAGIIDLSKRLPVYDFSLIVNKANLSALNLYTKYKNSNLSFTASTNMEGNSLDNMNGFIRLDDIVFTNNDKDLRIDSIYAKSVVANNNTEITIASNYLNGSVKGHFLYSTVGHTIDKIVQTYLPAVSFSKKTSFGDPNQMKIDLHVGNLNEITNVLELPLKMDGEVVVTGEVDEIKNILDLSVDVPTITRNNQIINNFQLKINNDQKDLQLTTRLQYRNSTDALINFFLTANAADDNVKMRIGWQNASMITNAGEFIIDTHFAKQDDKTTALINIDPAQVIIADTIWNIHQGSVYWGGDSALTVSNVRVENNDQYIYIDGKASNDPNDVLNVKLSKLNIDFILNLIGFNGFDFGGSVSGVVGIQSLFKKPLFAADLNVDNVTMNNMRVGDAKLHSELDDKTNNLLVTGLFMDGKDTVIIADGAYIPQADSISFMFDTRNLGLSFLDRYFDGVVDGVNGKGSGMVRLFGNTKDIGFEGDVFVKDGVGTVNILNTTYHFNDYVFLRHNSLTVRNFKLVDDNNNVGLANGYLNHSGLFQDMVYDFSINAKNIMALNTKSGDNENFFGKAFVDGNVHIFGNERLTNINVNGISKPHSKLYIRMASTSTASDNSFIRFKEPVSSRPDAKKALPQKSSKNYELKLNLQVEATPDAEVEFIIDPRAGDMISGRGSGNLRLEYDTNSDLKLFGTYTINSGYVSYSLQNVLRKEFKLDEGSSISWTGDLKNATVNIRGIYALTASLRDLMESASQSTTRSNIPVHCVLKLTDNLMHPTIAFGIELPSSDESTRQYIKNVINTEEMLNRQIMSLLFLDKFYKPEYLNTAGTSQSGSDALSFATATLNGWLSRMTQSNEFSLGLDMRVDQQSSQYQAAINYQPNDRLVINSNVGYQTDVLYDKGNRFIGDFDLEYKLVESGKLRFKAYNHTVDRLGTAKLSQGAGIVYREEFNGMGDMMNYYWHFFSKIWDREKREKEKQAEK